MIWLGGGGVSHGGNWKSAMLANPHSSALVHAWRWSTARRSTRFPHQTHSGVYPEIFIAPNRGIQRRHVRVWRGVNVRVVNIQPKLVPVVTLQIIYALRWRDVHRRNVEPRWIDEVREPAKD